MRITTLVLSSALFLAACNSNNTLSIQQFTKIYYDSLHKRFPKDTISIIDDKTIEARVQGYVGRIASDNAYNEYKASPDSIGKILTRYISSATETFESTNDVTINNVVPIIKPFNYLDGVDNMAGQMGAKDKIKPVHEKYNDQLVIAYAVDTKNSIRYLTEEDVKTFSVNKDSLRPIAIRNLEGILTRIEKRGSDGLYIITAGGNYEASILLMSTIVSKENFPVDGDLVIAIPNRDILMITGSKNKDGIKKIKDFAKKSFETGNYQVSEYLYRWNGKLFVKYE